MTEVLENLIDKQDNFEVVRDQIALILVTEVANQIALAAAKPNPEDWKLRIFTERSDAWEQFLDIEDSTDLSPLVNIWYDTGSFPKDKGDTIERQQHVATYNIDCYGVGVASDVAAGGHTPGDKEGALVVQRAVRLVRNILMAALNHRLQLDPAAVGIGIRWPQSIVSFQPQLDSNPIQHIHGARIALEVTFNEFSPQITPETLALVSVGVKRAEDGQIILEADYPST